MKKISASIILCAAILLCGCNKGTTFVETSPADETLSESAADAESEQTSAESPEDKPIEVSNLPSPADKEHPPLPDSAPASASLSDFVGIPLSDNPEDSSALNSKNYGYNPICFDSSNVYFSNPKDRQSLYVYDGEASRCLVKLPVHNLNYYDNKIFFISDGKTVNPDDRIPFPGFLYKYDLENKELTRITDFYISDPLYVGSEGIFYSNPDINGISTVYKLDEGSGEITPMHISYRVINYNGFHYNIITEYDEENKYIDNLCLSDNENSYILIASSSEIGYPTCECIANGKFYYKRQGKKSLTSISLKDGTVFEFPVSSEYGLFDYTVFKGTEYAVFGDGLYEFRGGKFVKCTSKSPLISIHNIYSGPNGMYALVNASVNGISFDIAEIILSYDNEKDETVYEYKIIA